MKRVVSPSSNANDTVTHNQKGLMSPMKLASKLPNHLILLPKDIYASWIYGPAGARGRKACLHVEWRSETRHTVDI